MVPAHLRAAVALLFCKQAKAGRNPCRNPANKLAKNSHQTNVAQRATLRFAVNLCLKILTLPNSFGVTNLMWMGHQTLPSGPTISAMAAISAYVTGAMVKWPITQTAMLLSQMEFSV
jgi:hypothetical protein